MRVSIAYASCAIRDESGRARTGSIAHGPHGLVRAVLEFTRDGGSARYGHVAHTGANIFTTSPRRRGRRGAEALRGVASDRGRRVVPQLRSGDARGRSERPLATHLRVLRRGVPH